MKPLRSTLNLTPTSTALGSLTEAVPGVVELLHAVHGQDGAAEVVNDHVKLARRALPERSLTPVVMGGVWAVAAPSELFGVSVAVCVPAVYATAAGTTVLLGSRSTKLLLLIVVGSIASLK